MVFLLQWKHFLIFSSWQISTCPLSASFKISDKVIPDILNRNYSSSYLLQENMLLLYELLIYNQIVYS